MITLESRPANIEGQGEIRIRELVRNALRMRPDRIIVGEVRGAETLDMLQAMNTGHDGSLTTIHANSPRDALARLETLVLTAGDRAPAPRDPRADRERVRPARADLSASSTARAAITHITEVLRHGVRRDHAPGHLHREAARRGERGRRPQLPAAPAARMHRPEAALPREAGANGVMLPPTFFRGRAATSRPASRRRTTAEAPGEASPPRGLRASRSLVPPAPPRRPAARFAGVDYERVSDSSGRRSCRRARPAAPAALTENGKPGRRLRAPQPRPGEERRARDRPLAVDAGPGAEGRRRGGPCVRGQRSRAATGSRVVAFGERAIRLTGFSSVDDRRGHRAPHDRGRPAVRGTALYDAVVLSAAALADETLAGARPDPAHRRAGGLELASLTRGDRRGPRGAGRRLPGRHREPAVLCPRRSSRSPPRPAARTAARPDRGAQARLRLDRRRAAAHVAAQYIDRRAPRRPARARAAPGGRDAQLTRPCPARLGGAAGRSSCPAGLGRGCGSLLIALLVGLLVLLAVLALMRRSRARASLRRRSRPISASPSGEARRPRPAASGSRPRRRAHARDRGDVRASEGLAHAAPPARARGRAAADGRVPLPRRRLAGSSARSCFRSSRVRLAGHPARRPRRSALPCPSATWHKAQAPARRVRRRSCRTCCSRSPRR